MPLRPAAFILLLSIATPLDAQVVSSGIEYLGNSHLHATYNDCWGYTAPNGREYALIGARTGTSIVDITDAPTLKEITFIPNPYPTPSIPMDIQVYRHYAYIANEVGGGIQIIDLTNLPISASLAGAYTEIQTSHNLFIDTTNAILYVQHHDEYGVMILSLADPLHPAEVDSLLGECHDLYADSKRLYVAEGSQGTFAIYERTSFSSLTFVRRIPPPADGGFAHSSAPTEDGKFLMTTYEDAGHTVKLWDISNPDTAFWTAQYLGASGLAHTVYIKGNYAYIAHYLDGLRILNIADRDDLSEVAFCDTYPFPGSGYHGAWGSFPFFASGKVLIADTESGLHVIRFLPPTSNADQARASVKFTLEQNYPNPFNPETAFSYQLSAISQTRLSVIDILGREVAVLVNGIKVPGNYQAVWNAGNYPSGVYFYRLSAGGQLMTKRMMLLK